MINRFGKRMWIIIVVLFYLIPLIITLYSIFSGSIAFWYDPARDLISGLDNLKKLTLIGPTSGIPGLFYGPYWIWMLSMGLLISHDPRIVAFIVAALPYFIILPFVFYKLSSVVGRGAAVIGWSLFMLAYGGYSVQLWNPHPAPLLIFIALTLLVFIPHKTKSVYDGAYIILTGFIAGLLVQFHISLGIAVVSGMILYQLSDSIIQCIKEKKKSVIFNYIVVFCLFVSGIFISAIPFFVFEIRHGFNQIQTIITTLLTPHSVVGVTGISNIQIITFFIERYSRLISLPLLASVCIGIITVAVFVYEKRNNKPKSNPYINRIFQISSLIGVWVLIVYLSSRNPVWDYHFIGVEVLFVFLLMALLSRARLLLYIYGVILIYIACMSLHSLYQETTRDPIRLTSLATKEYVVKEIFKDSPDDNFAIIAYNPAIYTYDYDYMVQWIAEKENREVPFKQSEQVSTVYLIFPPDTSDAIIEDFVNYKTVQTQFNTAQITDITDGTKIIKRVKNMQ